MPTKDKKVICGRTGREFPNIEAYNNHVCPITGLTPLDPAYYGTASMRASKEALRRGGSLTKTKEKQIDALIDEAKASGVDDKLAQHKSQRIKEEREARKR